jgi:hypothetical protein
VAKRKRATPCDRVYDGIRVSKRPNSVYVPPATEAELQEAERELGSRLPESYRAFLSRFGPGYIHDWAEIYGVKTIPKRRDRTVVSNTRTMREFFDKYVDPRPNQRWLLNVVYFGDYQGNAQFVWDPAAISTKRPLEYRIYELPRLEEEKPDAVAESFWEFVQWIDADIRRWRDPERVTEMGSGIQFTPTYLRAKKPPAKGDVKQWLAFNNHAARDLARSIRDGHPEAFPVLADALEEAGCTNADLLDSCRRGDPDVDGVWVLRVLLGEG